MIWAKVTFSFSGLHSWPEASGAESFLKHPHRHVFHCSVWVEQYHDDRDVEYIWLVNKLKGRFLGGDLGRMSCEMIADKILAYVESLVGVRKMKCEVLEDGENGALIER